MTSGDPRLVRAQELYDRATFYGDPSALVTSAADLDGVSADLALARGRLLHARFLTDRQEDPAQLAELTRAVELYAGLGDGAGEAAALFWLGTFYQVVRDDGAQALPALERSYALAADPLTRSYAARHLGFHARGRDDIATAQDLFEESLRLRREVGHTPAVAAALLPLADLAESTGDHATAQALLAEATDVATSCGATGVLGWIKAVRAEWAESP